MSLHAVFLNCTLKPSPATSNTAVLMDKVRSHMEPRGVTSDIIRLVDHRILPGVTSDEGDGDEWPVLLDRIKRADILIVGTPIWFGRRSSVAQRLLERLDGTYSEADEDTGQYPLYNTVAGVVVTGNEDGAHAAAGTTLFNLSHLGCVIPPNADTYWVGEAGPGPSYIEAGGDRHRYTDRTARMVAANTVALAETLRAHPISTNLKEIDAAADAYTREGGDG